MTIPFSKPVPSFLAFVQAEENGECWQDVTYRAYNLEGLTGLYTLTAALRKLKMTELEVQDVLTQSSLPNTEVKGRLVRWFVWYRLSTGDLVKWPLRQKTELPTSEHHPTQP